MHTTQQQRGGTLSGFIVGLLVGLGVALVVAVYISKVPIPLVDRGVQRQPDQEAIEKERNRDWNPNASLAGARTASGAASPAAPTAAEPATAAPAGPAPDALGELIQSRNAAPATAPAPADAPALADPFVYFVQAGAFRGQAEAESQRARLAMLGLQAEITEREQAGRPVFRVRLGPFQNKVDADIMQERLTGQGIEGNLVRVQR
jgi:cell division protein FtsN